MDKKKKIYSYICHDSYKPITAQEMAIMLDVPKCDYEEFFSIIDELANEGKILINKRGMIKKAPNENIIYGTIRLIRSGSGFVMPINTDGVSENEEIFIDKRNTNYAFDGDTVAIKLCSTQKGVKRKSKEGIVTRVVRRKNDEFVGTVIGSGKNAMFLIDSMSDALARISQDSACAQEGQKVLAKVVKYPDEKNRMTVRVINVLGDAGKLDSYIKGIIFEHKIPSEFSKETKKQVREIKREVDESELVGRRDFRGDRVITIDGEDARDLDDAVCIKKHDDSSYTLYVHIADVSYYVGENTPIDIDAYERATSVYFPQCVIPMLPRELSNGICSLNEGVDRLTMSLQIELDKDANVKDYTLCEGVIRSKHRMTYTNVTAILEGDEELSQKYSDICDDLFNMKELAMLLKSKRSERGAIDFNLDEPKVIFDENENIVDIKAYETGVSNEIIEQFMILANEVIAKHAQKNDLPFVYRIHEAPGVEKLTHLRKCLALFGIDFTFSEDEQISPKDIQKIVRSIKGHESESVIASLCLRSMTKAQYSPENLGHFGLAMAYYCHFTSPIRRYPDLAIHRILRESAKKMSKKRKDYLISFTQRSSIQSSEAEVRAIEAQRDADKVCACLYMSRFIGCEFDAVISSVTDFGIFVDLGGCIEGLVPMAQLCDDYYVYEQDLLRLRGERGGRIFALGDSVRVRLTDSNALERRIDFEIVGMKKDRKSAMRECGKRSSDLKKKNEGAKRKFKSFVKKKTRRKRR